MELQPQAAAAQATTETKARFKNAFSVLADSDDDEEGDEALEGASEGGKTSSLHSLDVAESAASSSVDVASNLVGSEGAERTGSAERAELPRGSCVAVQGTVRWGSCQ